MKDIIVNWFNDNGFNISLDPYDDKTIDIYMSQLQSKLPELYQLLVDSKKLPSGYYHKFIQLIEWKINEARHYAIIESSF